METFYTMPLSEASREPWRTSDPLGGVSSLRHPIGAVGRVEKGDLCDIKNFPPLEGQLLAFGEWLDRGKGREIFLALRWKVKIKNVPRKKCKISPTLF
jgi:hypothetical protein